MKFFLISSLLFVTQAAADQISPVIPTNLRCEFETNPQAVSTTTPGLSWALSGPSERGVRQTSYRLLVASTPEKLAAQEGDLWDSGDIRNYRSYFIPYQGKELKNGQIAYWKVQIRDQNQLPSAWSDTARFQIVLAKKAPAPRTLFKKDTSRISAFDCSDKNLNLLFEEAAASLPKVTSSQEIQLSLRAAAFHRQMYPEIKHWLTWLNASADKKGFYPATLPPDGSFGSTQSDAGILAAHTLRSMFGDDRFLKEHWPTMNAYLLARKKFDPAFSGRAFGQLPANTLAAEDPLPASAVHLASHGLVLRIMYELSRTAAQTPFEGPLIEAAQRNLQKSYQEKYLSKKGRLKYDSISGQLITLRYGLLSSSKQKKTVSDQLFELLAKKKETSPFSHGNLASAALLPVFTWTGNHEQAVQLLKTQSPKSLSPVALASISEWLIWMVAGIDSASSGFQEIRLAPYIPKKETLSFARAHYDSPHGRIVSHWHYEEKGLVYDVTLPHNTYGIVHLPAKAAQTILLDGKPLTDQAKGITKLNRQEKQTLINLLSGTYRFTVVD